MKNSTSAARAWRYTVIGLSAALSVSLIQTTAAAADPLSTVTIYVDATQPGRAIPRDFLGLSFEADLLHQHWTDPDAGKSTKKSPR
ncbi:hypothetical protein ACFRFQ_13895 [Rhodococcus sp. NPDC056743]|uniref:hypothetical protein n=1 Tax=Rhodococcus sp. NPDC056743 TaxID=3345934 RepID=UPI00366B7491